MNLQKRNVMGVDIDINSYTPETHPPIPLSEGNFEGFYWQDISEYIDEPNNPKLWNGGIRKFQDLDRQTEEFSAHLDRSGWDINYFPPAFDTEGNPVDGRKRIYTMAEKNEKWIPAARYSFPKTSKKERQTITAAIMGNMRSDYSNPALFEDFLSAAKKIVAGGDLNPHDPQDVDSWFTEMNIYDYLAKQSISKLKIAISNLNLHGNEFMYMMDRASAVNYILNTKVVSNLGIDNFKNQNDPDIPELVVFTPNEVNAYRILCKHILPNARVNRRTLIALYTMHYDTTEARKSIQSFPKGLDQLVADCGTFVGNELSGVKLDSPFISNSYEILGAIPQVRIGDNDLLHKRYWDANDFISTDQY